MTESVLYFYFKNFISISIRHHSQIVVKVPNDCVVNYCRCICPIRTYVNIYIQSGLGEKKYNMYM